MGWQDAPVIDKPSGGWQSAPLVDAVPPAAAAGAPVAASDGSPMKSLPLGMLEAAGSVASRTAASAIGGIVGLGRAAFPGPTGAGGDVSDRIRNALTYQPRTESGKRIVDEMTMLQAPLEKAGKWAGEKKLEDTGSPAHAAAVETLIQNLPMILGVPKGVSAAGAPTTAARYPTGHPKIEVPKSIMDKGIKLTPSYTEHPSKIGRLLEGIGGKPGTEKRMSQANEATMNEMAAKDLGLPPGTPINKTTVKPILERYGGLRDQIDNVSATYGTDGPLSAAATKIAGDQLTIWTHEGKPTPLAYKDLFDALQRPDYTPKYLQAKIRSLRDQANDNLTKQSGDTQLGNSQKATAKALEDFLERQLQTTHPNLVPAFRDARVQTAKVYDYLESTSDLGDVNAPKLARVTADEKRTGGVQDISVVGANFPKVAQPTSTSGGYQPHSAFDTAAAAGSAMAGKPSGVFEFIGARPAAREILASDFGQKKFVRPSGEPKPPSSFAQAKQTLKNNPAIASLAVAPYTDEEKERRYQDWKKRQKGKRNE